jgi:hypothetical protein
MRSPARVAWVGLCGMLVLAGGPLAEVSAQAKSADQAQTVAVPVYKPPLRGAPGGRVGGGTRGIASRDVFMLSVLAPGHTGLTVREQPVLYWFISADTALPAEIAIVDPNSTTPLLEKPLAGPITRGVHSIRLADHGVRLEPGVVYRWSVSVITDAGRRSRDILASGTIERIPPPATLDAALATAGPERSAFVYAEAGIWYDAMAAVCEMLARTPDSEPLRGQRAALLAQAGLPTIPIDDSPPGPPALNVGGPDMAPGGDQKAPSSSWKWMPWSWRLPPGVCTLRSGWPQ